MKIVHEDGSVTVGIIKSEKPVEKPVETVEKPKKKTAKKK